MSMEGIGNIENVNMHRRQRQNLSFNDSEYEMDVSYQSQPNIATNKDEIIDELNDKINKLNIELEIANTEIENINLENTTLKKEVQNYQNKIKLYKSVGIGEINFKKNSEYYTPLMFYSPQYKRRFKHFSCGENGQQSSSSLIYQNTKITRPLSSLMKDCPNQFRGISNLGNEYDVKNTTYQVNTSSPNSVNNTDMATVVEDENIVKSTPKTLSCTRKYAPGKLEKTIKHRIMIFADQTGYGMRDLLQNLLGNTFTVTSFIKPNASMSEILSSCIRMCQCFTKSDYVIILGGLNDKNPLKFQSFLYYIVNHIKNTNILIGEILKNKHLNVGMLNNVLKIISRNCTNVSLIPLDTHQGRTYNNRYRNKLIISRLFHREILRLNYKYEYIAYTAKLDESQGQGNKCLKHVFTQTCDLKTSKTLVIDATTQTDSFNADESFFRV